MDYGIPGLAPGFEPKHIDCKSLYTSLEERIKYLHYFLDFNAGTNSPRLPTNTLTLLSS